MPETRPPLRINPELLVFDQPSTRGTSILAGHGIIREDDGSFQAGIAGIRTKEIEDPEMLKIMFERWHQRLMEVLAAEAPKRGRRSQPRKDSFGNVVIRDGEWIVFPKINGMGPRGKFFRAGHHLDISSGRHTNAGSRGYRYGTLLANTWKNPNTEKSETFPEGGGSMTGFTVPQELLTEAGFRQILDPTSTLRQSQGVGLESVFALQVQYAFERAINHPSTNDGATLTVLDLNLEPKEDGGLDVIVRGTYKG